MRGLLILFLIYSSGWAKAGPYCDNRKQAVVAYTEHTSEAFKSYKLQMQMARRQGKILSSQQKSGVKMRFQSRTMRLIQGHLTSARKKLKLYKILKDKKASAKIQLKDCQRTEAFQKMQAERRAAQEEFTNVRAPASIKEYGSAGSSKDENYSGIESISSDSDD